MAFNTFLKTMHIKFDIKINRKVVIANNPYAYVLGFANTTVLQVVTSLTINKQK